MPKKIRLKMSKETFKAHYQMEVARIKRQLRKLAEKIVLRQSK